MGEGVRNRLEVIDAATHGMTSQKNLRTAISLDLLLLLF